ncbi:MAG: DoxX family protein [Phaeodactylibacter sp.]|nr:DoxX family protein [Phaeodactylibacter sp.]
MERTQSHPSVALFAFLRISIGICYLWFGLLKFFPGLSPAESLAIDTITCLTFGLLPAKVSILLLAIWEVVVGLSLISGFFMRYILIVALVHMALTFSPFFCFPGKIFGEAYFSLTIIGQYIIKNLVLIAGLLLLRSELRHSA